MRKYEKWQIFRSADSAVGVGVSNFRCYQKTVRYLLKKLMEREDVTGLVEATDAGREGELIFRLVYLIRQNAKSHSSVYGFLQWKTRQFRMAFLICKTERNMMIFIERLYAGSVRIGALE
ncbi:MAG: hypothetical protein V8R61_01810 [Enterocloster sp.]